MASRNVQRSARCNVCVFVAMSYLDFRHFAVTCCHHGSCERKVLCASFSVGCLLKKACAAREAGGGKVEVIRTAKAENRNSSRARYLYRMSLPAVMLDQGKIYPNSRLHLRRAIPSPTKPVFMIRSFYTCTYVRIPAACESLRSGRCLPRGIGPRAYQVQSGGGELAEHTGQAPLTMSEFGAVFRF